MVDASAAAGAAKWIGSALSGEAKYLYGVKRNVRRLQNDLESMQKLLQQVDANPHLTRQNEQLGKFAKDVRELAFRAEDAIESYILHVATEYDGKSFFLKVAYLAAHPYRIHMLVKEIEAIRQEINEAKQRYEAFQIIPITPQQAFVPVNPENYIHLVDEIVVGIEDDISNLAKLLVDPEEDFNVLATVGTGGAGKTTLATQLYNHSRVKSRFSHKAFVSISQEWSKVDVLQRIFTEVKGGGDIPSSYKELVRELHVFLNDKQYLIVLDDMWKEKAWNDIYPILPHSNRGCRVIITTRIEEVARCADNKLIIHKPQLLTEEEKWTLFSKVAMEGRVGIEKNAEFERLAREMLRKLEGLPLAVVTLAGVLRRKASHQWEKVSKVYANHILLKGRGRPNYGVVEDMLELSYLDMPAYLKPCFLYFAIFLEDWLFYANTFTIKWIAEGFVTEDRTGETLEDIATRLLEELAQRCVLQVTSRNIQGQIERFRVHDLMRELCIKKAKEYQFIGSSVSSTLRRIAVLPRELYPQENEHLRTLFNLCYDGSELPIEARRNLEAIPNKFKLLRVLSIQALDYVALPDDIGNLIHLRYLSIIDTEIFVLPKSIRNLRNLLYLFYTTRATTDVAVPDGLVGNMVHL